MLVESESGATSSGFEPETLSRAGDQVVDRGEAAALDVVVGSSTCHLAERGPAFQSRSNDSKSASGPRCASLSGLKIELTLVI
jgi:hypothetical protein